MGYSRVPVLCRSLFGCGRRSVFRRSLGGVPCRSPGRLALAEDLGDPHHGVVLAMPALAARILTAALLEGDDLLAAGVLHHLACHGEALDERRAHLGAAVVG